MALIDAVQQSGLSDESKYDIRHELEIKRAQFNNALAQALGITVSATVAPLTEPEGGGRGNPFLMGDPESSRIAIPGETVGVRVHAVSQAPSGVKLERLAVESRGPARELADRSARQRPGGRTRCQ